MNRLKHLRKEMDAITRGIIILLSKRLKTARKIARVKKREKLPILDEIREKELKKKILKTAKAHKLNPELVSTLLDEILRDTRKEMGEAL